MKSANEDKKKYFEVLLCQILNCNSISLTNNLYNQSLIKKRINMLQKSKSKKAGIMKYLVVIPMVVLSMALFSTTIVAQEVKKIEKVIEKSEQPQKSVIKIETNEVAKIAPMNPIKTEKNVIQEDETIETVEQLPQFEACKSVEKSEQKKCFESQIQKHIRKNLTYPVKALENNIQGKLNIIFLIDSNGNVKVLNVTGPENATDLIA